MKQKYLLGDRVKIRIGLDVIPEDEIICDEGVILTAFYFHYWHPDPKFHRIEYKVLLDDKKKYWGSIGPNIRVNQTDIVKGL